MEQQPTNQKQEFEVLDADIEAAQSHICEAIKLVGPSLTVELLAEVFANNAMAGYKSDALKSADDLTRQLMIAALNQYGYAAQCMIVASRIIGDCPVTFTETAPETDKPEGGQ